MLERGPRDSERLRRNAQAAVVERLHRIDKTLRLVAEEIFRRHSHVVEVERDRWRCAQAELVLLLADFESWQIGRDDERADSPTAAPRTTRVGTRHGENRAGGVAVGHPALGSVENPGVTIFHRLRR